MEQTRRVAPYRDRAVSVAVVAVAVAVALALALAVAVAVAVAVLSVILGEDLLFLLLTLLPHPNSVILSEVARTCATQSKDLRLQLSLLSPTPPKICPPERSRRTCFSRPDPKSPRKPEGPTFRWAAPHPPKPHRERLPPVPPGGVDERPALSRIAHTPNPGLRKSACPKMVQLFRTTKIYAQNKKSPIGIGVSP